LVEISEKTSGSIVVLLDFAMLKQIEQKNEK